MLALSLVLAAGGPTQARSQTTENGGVAALLRDLQQIVLTADARAWLALTVGDHSRAREFAELQLLSGVTRAVLQERDRANLPGTPPGTGYRLIVDVFVPLTGRLRRVEVRDDDGMLAEISK